MAASKLVVRQDAAWQRRRSTSYSTTCQLWFLTNTTSAVADDATDQLVLGTCMRISLITSIARRGDLLQQVQIC